MSLMFHHSECLCKKGAQGVGGGGDFLSLLLSPPLVTGCELRTTVLVAWHVLH